MYFQITMWTIFNLLAICACAIHAQEWVLDWAEEFDGDEINATTWQHEVTMWGGGVRKRLYGKCAYVYICVYFYLHSCF